MLIVLFSGTSAQRLKKILSAKKISSEIIQTPKSISEGGCTYSLRIKSKSEKDILPIISEARINVKGVFEEIKDGNNISYDQKIL